MTQSGVVREVTVTFRVYGSESDTEALEAVTKLTETHTYREDRTGFLIGVDIGKVNRFRLVDLRDKMTADRETRIRRHNGDDPK